VHLLKYGAHEELKKQPMNHIEEHQERLGQALPARILELLDKAPTARAAVLRERLNTEFPVLQDRLARLC
jgi:hypothetical protein